MQTKSKSWVLENTVICHTGHEKSLEICSRIHQATEIPLIHVKDYEVGKRPIVYGLFRDTDRAMRPAMWAGIDYFYVDHGYYNYKMYDGYYRICKNNLIHGVYTGMFVPNDIPIRNANPVFNKLVVLAKPNLQGSFFLPFIKVMPEEWVDALRWRYEQAGWDVIVSGKTGQLRLLKDLVNEENIGLVVGHDSAVEAFAVQHGIHTANVSYETRQQTYRLVEPNAPLTWLRQLEKIRWYANRQTKLADLTWEHFV